MSIPMTRGLGVALVIISIFMWSTAGLFVRMAELDLWSIVAWRSIFGFVVLAGFIVLRDRAFPGGAAAQSSFGWPGVLVVSVSVVSAISYIAALQWTTVANVLIVYAVLPFLAAAIAYVWLRERVTYRFVVAALLALAGVALMLGSATTGRDFLGIGAAFVMTVTFAWQLVYMKRRRELDTALVVALSAGVCTLVAIPFLQHAIPEPRQILACALYGVVSTGLAAILLLVGGRAIGSGEAGLISLLDIILGPFWVWLFLNERVPPQALLGGGIVVLAVAWHLASLHKPAKSPARG